MPNFKGSKREFIQALGVTLVLDMLVVVSAVF